MLKKIKNIFPKAYHFYNHLKRRRKIAEIESLKKLKYDDYKKIISKEYRVRIGHELDWNNLRSYTEKMQWEKIENHDHRKTLLADKYLVRDWIKEKIGDEYLIPLLGVWDSFDEIDFDKLPDRFVLKTNHGSGTNLIVKSKSNFDKATARMMFNDWMKMDFAFVNSIQLHYSTIPRKIIAEKYLETSLGELQDYKFLCFNGKPYFCWVDLGRFKKHTRTVFNMNWERQEWTQSHCGTYEGTIEKPLGFEKMVELAKILSYGFAQVRVDLYNVNGKIYFGEMTFTNGSGLDPIVPEEYDYVLGQLWSIS